MNIKTLKKITRIKNKDIAGFFNLSLNSYESSSAKKKYENALVSFFEFTKNIDPPGENPGEPDPTQTYLFCCNWCGDSNQETPKFCKTCGNEINYEVKEL